MEQTPSHTLSYSSASTILSCEAKWAHAKLWNTPVDHDADTDTFAFRFGKAFHSCHEWAMHELAYFEDKHEEYLHKAMKEQNLPADKETEPHLCSAIVSSLLLWSKTGLRAIKCELEIRDQFTIGFIDFIAIDPSTREWWIGDLKTASRASDIALRLRRDAQLSLYASFRNQVAEALHLDVTLFKGCLYRETIKTKITVKANEKPMAFAKRSLAESRLFWIPVEEMSVEPVATHAFVYQRMVEIRNGRAPIRNYKACNDWNKTCEFWSQCHGKIASQCRDEASYRTMYLARNGKDVEIVAFDLTKPLSSDSVSDELLALL